MGYRGYREELHSLIVTCVSGVVNISSDIHLDGILGRGRVQARSITANHIYFSDILHLTSSKEHDCCVQHSEILEHYSVALQRTILQ